MDAGSATAFDEAGSMRAAPLADNGCHRRLLNWVAFAPAFCF